MKQEYVLIRLSTQGLIELFRHECPEPVYDMQAKHMRLNPTGNYQVLMSGD